MFFLNFSSAFHYSGASPVLFTFKVCFSGAFPVLFTFQVLFISLSLFRCFPCAFHFSGAFPVLFTFQVLSLCFSLFRCAFHAKCHFSCMKDHLLTFMHHQTHICVHRCNTYTIHAPPNIHSWPSLCTLLNTRSK